MGEIKAAVTDTHPLLYHARGGRSLGKRARAAFLACEERKTLIYVPVGVAWEITVLVRAARVTLALCGVRFEASATTSFRTRRFNRSISLSSRR